MPSDPSPLRRVAQSLLFTIFFYSLLACACILLFPLLLFPKRVLYRSTRLWGSLSFRVYRLALGTDYVLRNMEKIPDTPCIIACKHQSAWDTIALVSFMPRHALVMKRTLIWIPVYGLYLLKLGALPLKRSGSASTMRRLLRLAQKKMEAGHKIVIFPEGTRRPLGAPPDYKPGVAGLYTHLNIPCVPVALNSGYFWPRRTLRHRGGGRIVLECLDPIAPGLSRKDFMQTLEDRIEHASARLLEEAASS